MACRSRRPHSHPNQHTPDELKLIQNLRRRNPNLGLPELWHRLRQRGYSRRPESLDVHLYSLSGIGHLLIGLGLVRFFLGRGGRQPQPAQYPKQVVPRACITDPEPHLFQYTASVRRQTSDLRRPLLFPKVTIRCLPCGGRPGCQRAFAGLVWLQSAASVRRQTRPSALSRVPVRVTIRCLRAEADLGNQSQQSGFPRYNPLPPCGGRRSGCKPIDNTLPLQSAASVRRQTQPRRRLD